jgi:hypothetical protein
VVVLVSFKGVWRRYFDTGVALFGQGRDVSKLGS